MQRDDYLPNPETSSALDKLVCIHGLSSFNFYKKNSTLKAARLALEWHCFLSPFSFSSDHSLPVLAITNRPIPVPLVLRSLSLKMGLL